MLRMAQIQYIKDLYENEDLSLREIARRTQHSFTTVRKYALQDDFNDVKPLTIRRSDYPVLQEYIPKIDEWLEADKKVPRKQRHSVKRIYDRLREEEHFTGSYSCVRRYVRKKKQLMRSEQEGYLPIEHPAGQAQCDFGEFQYYDLQGKDRKGYELTLSFPYSNKGYSQVFPSQNQECLLEGLKRIFEYMGGVPTRIRFDNMSTAVVQVLKGGERILTDGFYRFMLHYRFQADFCNPASGNEKGNVENKVGYCRRNHLVPVPTITSFEEFNDRIWDWCEKDGERPHYQRGTLINALFEEDHDRFLELPANPFQVFRFSEVTVNKTGFATVDTNRYSLSPNLFGEKVQARVFFDRIEFYHDHRMIAQFQRCYDTNREIYDWTQYVAVLCKKPGAAEHTRFFRYMPEQWQTFLTATAGKERKNALMLLQEIVEDGNASLCDDVLQLASENGRMDTDSIRQCYYLIARQEYHPTPLQLTESPLLNYKPNLSAYDRLVGGDSV